jgi:GNAT superfamily N-acetyltransferase
MIKKLLATLKDLKKTAYHHYGNHPLSILKFLYYGVFKINTFIVFEHKLTQEVPYYHLDPGIKIVLPTLKELDEIRKGKELTREFFYDRILNLKTCFVAFYEDELAYIHWVCFKGDYSRFLKMGDNVAEINYATTLPKFRGRSLSAKMFAYTTNYLQDRGYKKIIMICHEDNPPIIKSFNRAGYNEVSRIKAIGPFNKKIHV